MRLKALIRAGGVALAALAIPAAQTPAAPKTAAAAPRTTMVYKDPGAPIAARVDDLLARMTLDEKIVQVTTVWENKAKFLDANLHYDDAKMRANFPLGVGGVARPSDARGPVSPRTLPGRDVRQTVALVNALQHYQMTQTRLGIPILFHEEGLHGYAALGATSFPQAIALASSWDPDLVRRVNGVTAREISARALIVTVSERRRSRLAAWTTSTNSSPAETSTSCSFLWPT